MPDPNPRNLRNVREIASVNESLVRSKGETDRMLRITLVAVDKYFFGMSDKLLDLPRGEKLQREVVDQARATLGQIEARTVIDPSAPGFTTPYNIT